MKKTVAKIKRIRKKVIKLGPLVRKSHYYIKSSTSKNLSLVGIKRKRLLPMGDFATLGGGKHTGPFH
jgi:hypothetical protein